MVNNSTNINKANNHFFSSVTERKEKTTIYDIRNINPSLAQAQQYGRIKPVKGIPSPNS